MTAPNRFLTTKEDAFGEEILHFRVGFPAPGALVSPSPIEEHRRELEASRAAAASPCSGHSGFVGAGSSSHLQ